MNTEQLKDTVAMPVVGRPAANVQVTWSGDHRFDGVRASGGPSIRMDSSGVTGPSPVDTLLCALASCTGVDVVDILAKRRTPVSALTVDVQGDRFSGIPGRVTAIHMRYRIEGTGIDRVHAERAIELAVTKYCSVRDTLDAQMPVTWELALNHGSAADSAAR